MIPKRIVFREPVPAGRPAISEAELEFHPCAVCVGHDGLPEPAGRHGLDLAFEVLDQGVGLLVFRARIAAALRVRLIVVAAVPDAHCREVVPADDERCANGRNELHLPDDTLIRRGAAVAPVDVISGLQPGDKQVRRLMQRKEPFGVGHPLIGVVRRRRAIVHPTMLADLRRTRPIPSRRGASG